jgi:hypothetical protein
MLEVKEIGRLTAERRSPMEFGPGMVLMSFEVSDMAEVGNTAGESWTREGERFYE